MNAHSTRSASIALPGADARGESLDWPSAQMNHSVKQSPPFTTELPAKTNASAASDHPVDPSADAATALRTRLLQMIVANEQLRKSQATVSRHGE